MCYDDVLLVHDSFFLIVGNYSTVKEWIDIKQADNYWLMKKTVSTIFCSVSMIISEDRENIFKQ